MASKNTPKVPNKIPETRIVGPSRFRSPTEVIQSDSLFVRGNPYQQSDEVSPVEVVGSAEDKDAPDLSDITVYTALTRKRSSVTNEVYYEIVYKVRNSSLTPDLVKGVDARIVGTEPQND